MKHLSSLRIIKLGTICFTASEIASTVTLKIKSDLGIGGGSTSTLIDGERKILVDTSFDCEWLDDPINNERNASNLVRSLGDLGIVPGDIDAVFITHWHRDHFGNLGVFPKAQRLASKRLVERFGLEDFIGVDDQEEIGDGVKVMLTPGHTIDHASVMVNTVLGGMKARIAIAGDAIISDAYFQSGRIWQYNADFYDLGAARESMLRLINASDLVIPGHGVPFMAYHPNAMPKNSRLCGSADES